MTNLSEIAGRFKVVRKLGTGGSGDVYLCLDSDGTQAAVKLFSLEGVPPAERDRLGKQKTREARSVASKLADTRLLDLIDAGFDHDLDRHYIATAFVPGIPLSDWVRENGAPPVEQAVAWALDLTEQLSVVHDLEVAHFDVKPANIIIREEDESAQLIDFGEALARNWTRSEQHRTGVRGTLAYMAPEIRSGQQIGWNPGADVFGFGTVFYEMLTGLQAFSDRPGFTSVIDGSSEGQPALDVWHYPPEIPSRSVPEPLRNLCRKCLDPDSRERPRAVDVHKLLTGWAGPQTETQESPSRETLPAGRSGHSLLILVAASIAMALTMFLIGASSDREPDGPTDTVGGRSVPTADGTAELTVAGVPVPTLPVLATVQPQRFEFFEGGILGFDLTDAAVFEEAQPPLSLSDIPELHGTIYLSRLLYFRSFILPPETKVIERRAGRILTQVPRSVDANVWAAPLVSDAVPVNVESRSGGVVTVRPVEPLTDGVYCLHSGPLLADLPPKVTVPFIIRGFGVPVVAGSQLTTDGSQLTFRVRLRNDGTGEFNRWSARMWLNYAESGRLVRAHSRNLETVSVAPAAEHELISTWTGSEMTAGKYHVSCKVGNRDFNSPETTWFDAVTAPPFQIDEDGGVRILSKPRHLDPSLTLTGHSDRVWSLAFHPDGKRLFSSSEDRTIRCWSLESGQETDRFTQHAENLLTLAVAENGQAVLSAGFDRSAWLWTLEDHIVFENFTGHQGKIWQAVFRPEHQQVITASEDGTLRLWSTQTGGELARWPDQPTLRRGAMLSVAVDPEGDFCIAGSSDGLLVRWDLNTMQAVSRQGEGWIRGVAVSPDSRHAAVGYGEELLWLDTDTLASVKVLSSPETAIFGVAMTPDGGRVVSARRDESVLVSALDESLQSILCDGHRDEVLSVAVSHDARRVAAGAADGTVQVWELPPVP